MLTKLCGPIVGNSNYTILTIILTRTCLMQLGNLWITHIMASSGFIIGFEMHNISHVGWLHDPGICQLHYHVGPLNKMGIFVSYSCIQGELKNLGGAIFPTLYIGIIVHPINIGKKHCHPILFHEQHYNNNNNNIIANTDAIHNTLII